MLAGRLFLSYHVLSVLATLSFAYGQHNSDNNSLLPRQQSRRLGSYQKSTPFFPEGLDKATFLGECPKNEVIDVKLDVRSIIPHDGQQSDDTQQKTRTLTMANLYFKPDNDKPGPHDPIPRTKGFSTVMSISWGGRWSSLRDFHYDGLAEKVWGDVCRQAVEYHRYLPVYFKKYPDIDLVPSSRIGSFPELCPSSTNYVIGMCVLIRSDTHTPLDMPGVAVAAAALMQDVTAVFQSDDPGEITDTIDQWRKAGALDKAQSRKRPPLSSPGSARQQHERM